MTHGVPGASLADQRDRTAHGSHAIRQIEGRGAIEMARKVRNHVGEIFRYAIPDGLCESDPVPRAHPPTDRPF
jgi:hypothetical protein